MSIIIYNYASNPTQLQNTKSASVTQTTLLLGDGLEHRLPCSLYGDNQEGKLSSLILAVM